MRWMASCGARKKARGLARGTWAGVLAKLMAQLAGCYGCLTFNFNNLYVYISDSIFMRNK